MPRSGIESHSVKEPSIQDWIVEVKEFSRSEGVRYERDKASPEHERYVEQGTCTVTYIHWFIRTFTHSFIRSKAIHFLLIFIKSGEMYIFIL